jgi:hypothetical protein
MGERTNKFAAVFIGILVTLPAFSATSDHYQCKTRHDLVGPCWTVHGRLRVGNGTPSARIWPIGTHRLLGVMEQDFNNDEEFAAPAPLRQYGFDAQIFADFFVCPLTKTKPGVMQSVCISGAKHIRVDRFSNGGADSKDTWSQLPDVVLH